jgi:nicotinamidase-related amidase/type 1 glutamine amidotransferase
MKRRTGCWDSRSVIRITFEGEEPNIECRTRNVEVFFRSSFDIRYSMFISPRSWTEIKGIPMPRSNHRHPRAELWISFSLSLFVLLLVGFPPATASAPNASDTKAFSVTAQRRDGTGRVLQPRVTIDPKRTAIVIVDMWDRHWCKTYTQRVANMVPRMNQTLSAARRLGIPIVHAPSDVVDFYATFPRRKAMLAIPSHPMPVVQEVRLPAEPCGEDCCECGPDMPCQSRGVWQRQHPDLQIGDGDYIADCNNARELLNFAQEKRVDTLIYMGVASNMCVIGRACGMVNMRRHGLNVLFVGDLVNAITANGADPSSRQPDPNFTPAKGSALVQRYLEQHLAPSLESRQLIDEAGLATRGDDRRPHIVFVIAEQEYDTHRTLPAFAEKYLDDYRCTFCFAEGNDGPDRNHVRGLEALHDADLLVLSMRRRALPVVEMDHLERYLRAGNPVVALRVSVVPFQVNEQDRPAGHVRWQDFDQEVLGCHYTGYPGQSRETGCDVWVADGAGDHPILHGIDAAGFHSPSWLYRLEPRGDNATVLMLGRWQPDAPAQPVTLTNVYQGARVAYTSLGHPDDFQIPVFNRLLRNAIDWALDKS